EEVYACPHSSSYDVNIIEKGQAPTSDSCEEGDNWDAEEYRSRSWKETSVLRSSQVWTTHHAGSSWRCHGLAVTRLLFNWNGSDARQMYQRAEYRCSNLTRLVSQVPPAHPQARLRMVSSSSLYHQDQ